ncbi:MAG: ribonuclease HII [Porticoccaceae bacterium]|nr:ribonuclease HII [Porticoccaceae bacterium]
MTDWLPPLGVKTLAGVDEVGRGPLAGDVVVAAVILPKSHGLRGLDDSKRLSVSRREALFELITRCALCYSIGRSGVEEIDRVNILQATLNAMHRAVNGLSMQPDFVVVDGNRLPQWQFRSEAVIKGDGRVDAISAASIVAKVIRDREMQLIDQQYPGYGFAAHKGYGTAQHLSALRAFGPTPIHRLSFAPVRNWRIQSE